MHSRLSIGRQVIKMKFDVLEDMSVLVMTQKRNKVIRKAE